LVIPTEGRDLSSPSPRSSKKLVAPRVFLLICLRVLRLVIPTEGRDLSSPSPRSSKKPVAPRVL
ncbi:MAG: hypothetical protein WA772_18495, partial [Candidatus Acidiferrales bacterium]